MTSKVYASAAEAVADIGDGATLAVGDGADDGAEDETKDQGSDRHGGISLRFLQMCQWLVTFIRFFR